MVDNDRVDSYVSPRYSPIVQSVERWTVNPYVAGSSPARGAILNSKHPDGCFFLAVNLLGNLYSVLFRIVLT